MPAGRSELRHNYPQCIKELAKTVPNINFTVSAFHNFKEMFKVKIIHMVAHINNDVSYSTDTGFLLTKHVPLSAGELNSCVGR